MARLRFKKILPRVVVRLIQRARGQPPHQIPIGLVRFGDFKRLSPIGARFGWERGTPVDRHYVESFLARNSDAIHGRILEVGDDRYTRRFGGSRVKHTDILSIETTNPKATIIGDLTQPGTLPEGLFDCIILTQVLQLVFDLPAAITALHQALKPGGVLLVTMPGVTPLGVEGATFYWALTAPALRCLLEARFAQDAISVEAHGNIFTATAFLYGLAIEELDVSDLNIDDWKYPVTISARTEKLGR